MQRETEETKIRFEKRGDNNYTEGGYDEVTLSITGLYGEVSFAYGGFHPDGIVTRYTGFCYPGSPGGWGYSSIICSKERALEIFQYNAMSHASNYIE
jgi:hypothetical protein